MLNSFISQNETDDISQEGSEVVDLSPSTVRIKGVCTMHDKFVPPFEEVAGKSPIERGDDPLNTAQDQVVSGLRAR